MTLPLSYTVKAVCTTVLRICTVRCVCILLVVQVVVIIKTRFCTRPQLASSLFHSSQVGSAQLEKQQFELAWLAAALSRQPLETDPVARLLLATDEAARPAERADACSLPKREVRMRS